MPPRRQRSSRAGAARARVGPRSGCTGQWRFPSGRGPTGSSAVDTTTIQRRQDQRDLVATEIAPQPPNRASAVLGSFDLAHHARCPRSARTQQRRRRLRLSVLEVLDSAMVHRPVVDLSAPARSWGWLGLASKAFPQGWLTFTYRWKGDVKRCGERSRWRPPGH